MLGLLISDAYGSWYEWTKKAREKLEYDSRVIPCTLKTDVDRSSGSNMEINYFGIEQGNYSSESYKLVDGERIICINGEVYRDCADIVGFWASWDLQGPCVLKSEYESPGID